MQIIVTARPNYVALGLALGLIAIVPLVASIILGMLSGFVIRRLGSGKNLYPWERTVLRPLGWVLMGLWYTIAAVLLVTVALVQMV